MRKVNVILLISSVIVGGWIGKSIFEPKLPTIALAMPSGYCGDFYIHLKEVKAIPLENPESYIFVYVHDSNARGAEIEVPFSEEGWIINFSYYRQNGIHPKTGVKSVGYGTTYTIEPKGEDCHNRVEIGNWEEPKLLIGGE